MATLVRTKDLTLFIDPGAALGPKRYGLPPDKVEWQRLHALKGKIKALLKEADIIVLSHYHYDHYDPEWAPFFKGKKVFLKDPEGNINRNQAQRAKELLKRLAAAGVTWCAAEGQKLVFGNTQLHFSPPLQHGPEKRFGYVVAVAVREDGFCFIHSSDISGPVEEAPLIFFRDQDPQVLFVDGPGTYLGPRFGLEALTEASRLLVQYLTESGLSTLVLDHHLLRDLEWHRWARPIFDIAAKRGVLVTTAAGFMGQKDLVLEAERAKRYKMHFRNLTR